MKKYLKLILCIVLSGSFALGLAACRKDPKPEDSSQGGQTQYTDIDFVKNGNSDYLIVLPDEASDEEKKAAQMLQNYVLQSTSCMLPIVTDEKMRYDESQKIISVGDTSLLRGSGVKIDETELNGDGYKLVRKGNTVVLAGGTDVGTIYAANEFAKKQLNYAFYAVDETYYEKFNNVKLIDFNITEIPEFAERTSYYRSIMIADEDARLRMRADSGDEWGLAHHSFFLLIEPEVYLKDHPDWFSPESEGQHQLCITNNEMKAELIKNLKKFIVEMPDKKYFMIGQSDMHNLCDCDRPHADGEMTCRESHKKYGTSGTMMRFVNSIAREIKEWQKTACPERELYIGVFAYQDTKHAPVTFDVNTGKYIPVDPSVVAEDNVIVRYAPLEACFSHPLNAKCNQVFDTAIKGWQAISNNFAIWSYCTYFSNFLVHFNNWSTMQANYRIYKDMGATIIMDQGAGTETQGTPFEALRIYLQTQLMWDLEQDVNYMIDDFITHYYKSAAPYIKEFLGLTRDHFTSVEEEWAKNGETFCSKVTTVYEPQILDAKVLPYEFICRQQELIEKALEAADTESDPAVRETIRRRVLGESLSPRAMMLELHSSEYSKEQLSVMLDEFEDIAGQVGLKNYDEHTLLGVALSEFRARFELDVQ